MAIEYDLDLSTASSTRDVTGYFATRTGCDVKEDGFATGTGLQLLAATSPAEDLDVHVELFGEVDLVNVTFRFIPTAGSPPDTAGMFAAVVEYLADHPDDLAILTYNGDRILLQQLEPGTISFDTTWRDYVTADDDVLDFIQGDHEIGALPQLFI